MCLVKALIKNNNATDKNNKNNRNKKQKGADQHSWMFLDALLADRPFCDLLMTVFPPPRTAESFCSELVGLFVCLHDQKVRPQKRKASGSSVRDPDLYTVTPLKTIT